MNSIIIKHYGKIIIVPVYIIVLILGFFRINIIYNQYFIEQFPSDKDYNTVRNTVLNINIVSLVIITILFFVLNKFFYKKKSWLFRLLFIPFILLFQFFLSSSIIDFAEKSNNFEINSDIGVIWVVIYPANILILFLAGALFDHQKNKNRTH